MIQKANSYNRRFPT